MIRIVENNDWVIFTLLGGIAVYIIMFYWLLKGEKLWRFLSKNRTESSNNLPTWVIISSVYLVILSVLLSQYIPIVPRYIEDYQIFNWYLNKIGLMIIILWGYYFIKSIITLIFYKSIRQTKRWFSLAFVAQRFYFIESLVLMGVCVAHYYFPIDRVEAYVYYIIFLIAFFVMKLFFYLFHKEQPLPREWYYKILYICTLQILPLLAVWKFIFL